MTFDIVSVIKETGDWAADNRAGREAAIRCLSYICENRDPNHLSAVARNVVASGRFGAIEVGFFTVIAIMLLDLG